MENIAKIYIADLGFCNKNRETISKLHEKIEFINTEINIGNSDVLFSKNWVNAISQKTAALYLLIKNGCTPVVMLDCDTIVIEDFSDMINHDFDIQFCKRASPVLRGDGLLLEYIASFVSINSTSALSFVIEWIKRIEERINLNMSPPYETPAMVELINKNTGLKLGSLDENIVSCENNYHSGITKIIHAKSTRKNEHFSSLRFAKIKNLPYRKTLNFLNRKDIIAFTIFMILWRIFRIIRPKNIKLQKLPNE